MQGTQVVFLIMYFLLMNRLCISQDILSEKDTLPKKTYIENIDSLNPINNIRKGVVVFQAVNDTLEGYFKVYDENEVLRFKANVFNGKKEGAAYSYNSKGVLEEIRSYSKDIPISRIFMDHRGRIHKTVEYNFSMKKHGKEILYRNNGSKFSIKKWNNGRLAKKTYFYLFGNIQSIFYYDKDGVQTKVEEYKRNGKIKEVFE